MLLQLTFPHARVCQRCAFDGQRVDLFAGPGVVRPGVTGLDVVGVVANAVAELRLHQAPIAVVVDLEEANQIMEFDGAVYFTLERNVHFRIGPLS